MKNIYLLFFSISVFFVQAQQVSIMQPAIKNSHVKLDSVYLSGGYIIRTNNSLEGLTEKWIVKEYDEDKNPTKFMVYHFQDPYSPIIIDSLRITLEHYPIDEFISTFKGSNLTGSNSTYFDYPNSRIYNLFNLKSVNEEIYNTNTQEWISVYNETSIGDLRFPISKTISSTQNYYDASFNLFNANKFEGVLDEFGYLTGGIYYSWDEIIGFAPYLKYVFENTYNSEAKLIETIRKRIENLDTEEEILVAKYNINYGFDFFEYTEQLPINNNTWDIPTYKYRVDYINNNPIITRFNWTNGEWVEIIPDISDTVFYFNNGMYLGSSYETPTIGDGSHQLIYNEDAILINEISSSSCGDGCGDFEEKEFYYSSDGTNTINDYNLDKIIIYPNPAKHSISINSETELPYTIYSIQGKKLLNGISSRIIDISKLQTGIYFIKLKTKNGFVNKRFIIK